MNNYIYTFGKILRIYSGSRKTTTLLGVDIMMLMPILVRLYKLYIN